MKRKPRKDGHNTTTIAVIVAAMVAFCAIQGAEIIYDNMRIPGVPGAHDIPLWRVHMISACAGSITFVLTLFFLESLGKKSRASALRSIFPWIPLVALTAIAAVVHIPLLLVVLLGALYCPWAYARTLAAR